jgi:transcriptional regulator with XRE-family HTH domain
MKKIKDDIVLELKKVMNEKGLSASVVSRFVGCNQAQVSRWVKGQARPTPVYRDLIRKGLKRIKSL